MIILLVRLLVCIYNRSLIFFLELLFASLSSLVFLSFWGSLSLSVWILLGFEGGFFIFVFSSLEPLLLFDSSSLSYISTSSNDDFSLKFKCIVIALKMMFLKILRFLTWITIFWPLMWILQIVWPSNLTNLSLKKWVSHFANFKLCSSSCTNTYTLELGIWRYCIASKAWFYIFVRLILAIYIQVSCRFLRWVIAYMISVQKVSSIFPSKIIVFIMFIIVFRF